MADPEDDIQFVRDLFHNINDLPNSQTPKVREWQIILSLLRKALKVRILLFTSLDAEIGKMIPNTAAFKSILCLLFTAVKDLF